MRIFLFIVACILVATYAFAQGETIVQGLIGLPDEGILLTGTLDHPVIENHTQRIIVAYTIDYIPQGLAETISAWPVWNRNLRVMPGQSREVAHQTRILVAAPGKEELSDPTKRTAVKIDAVVFDDGEVVGPDSTRTLQRLKDNMDLQHQVHQVLLTQGWAAIEQMAQRTSAETRQAGHDPKENYYAQMLLTYRRQQGDDIAMKIAHSTEFYPQLHRKGQ